MNKKDYILQLVKKGYLKEEIEVLVNAKFPDIVAVPNPDAASVPLQEAYDRAIDLVIKVDELKASTTYVDSKQRVFDLSGVLTDANIYTELNKLKVGDIFIANDSVEVLPATIGLVGFIIGKGADYVTIQIMGTAPVDGNASCYIGTFAFRNDGQHIRSYINTSDTAKVIEALSGSTLEFTDGTTITI